MPQLPLWLCWELHGEVAEAQGALQRGCPPKGRTYPTTLLSQAGSSHVSRVTGAGSNGEKPRLSLQAGLHLAEEEDRENPAQDPQLSHRGPHHESLPWAALPNDPAGCQSEARRSLWKKSRM